MVTAPPPFSLSLSTYQGAFYFLFNVMNLWAGGYSQGKCRPSQMPKSLTTQLSTCKIHLQWGSTSCKLLDPCTMSRMEVGKSIFLSHGTSAPIHGRWVTPNWWQLPGRDIPQYLDWGLTPCQVIYPRCQRMATLRQRVPQGACSGPRPSLLYSGLLYLFLTTKGRNNRTQTFPHQCDHNSGGAEPERMRPGRAQDNKAWKSQQSKTGPKRQ